MRAVCPIKAGWADSARGVFARVGDVGRSSPVRGRVESSASGSSAPVLRLGQRSPRQEPRIVRRRLALRGTRGSRRAAQARVVPVVNTLAVFGVAATTGTAVIMGSLLGMCWVERKLVGRRPRVPAVSAAVLAGASAPDRAGEVPAGPAAAVPDQARATAPSARPASPAGPVPSARPVPTAERVPAAAPARGAAPRHRRAEPARPRIARLGVPAFSGLLVLVALFASTVSAGLGASGPGPVVRTPARPNRHVATARRRRASRPGDAGVTASPGVGSAQVRGSGSRRSRTRARRRS